MSELLTRIQEMQSAANSAYESMTRTERCKEYCRVAAQHLLWILEQASMPESGRECTDFLQELVEVEFYDLSDLRAAAASQYYGYLVLFGTHQESIMDETLQELALGVCQDVLMSCEEYREKLRDARPPVKLRVVAGTAVASPTG